MLADGTVFGSSNSNQPPLLTISVPTGLQYGNRLNRGSIALNQSNLKVKPRQNISLLGGNLNLKRTTLDAPGGSINLASVTGQEIVNFNDLNGSIPTQIQRGNINISDRLRVVESAAIISNTNSSGDAGKIKIKATELVELIGRSNNSARRRATQIVSAVRRQGQGKGGDIQIATKRLLVRDGALINVGTDNLTNSGNLLVQADEVIVLNGTTEGIPSRINAQVEELGSGQGGDIFLATSNLLLQDGAQISASNLGSGNGGNIKIIANIINLNGFVFNPGDGLFVYSINQSKTLLIK